MTKDTMITRNFQNNSSRWDHQKQYHFTPYLTRQYQLHLRSHGMLCYFNKHNEERSGKVVVAANHKKNQLENTRITNHWVVSEKDIRTWDNAVLTTAEIRRPKIAFSSHVVWITCTRELQNSSWNEWVAGESEFLVYMTVRNVICHLQSGRRFQVFSSTVSG
jgi:hypothetical protein